MAGIGCRVGPAAVQLDRRTGLVVADRQPTSGTDGWDRLLSNETGDWH